MIRAQLKYKAEFMTQPGDQNATSYAQHTLPGIPAAPQVDSMAVGAECMERFTSTFERSARRWEFVVYPSMFAFVVLAFYGFYLIYSLTTDMGLLARSADHNMTVMTENMGQITRSIVVMTDRVDSMSNNFQEVSHKMDALEPMVEGITTMTRTMDTLTPILANMNQMNRSIRTMAVSTRRMGYDMTQMNRSVARPMNMMNKFMPW